MTKEIHYRCLESMYASAPLNAFFQPTLEVRDREATVAIEISEKFYHAAGAIHGAVYFKMLDDAAFFAANSIETEVFVLTKSFTIHFTRPVVFGKFCSVGRIVEENEEGIVAEATVYNAGGKRSGYGSGIFARGKRPLQDVPGYRKALEKSLGHF